MSKVNRGNGQWREMLFGIQQSFRIDVTDAKVLRFPDASSSALIMSSGYVMEKRLCSNLKTAYTDAYHANLFAQEKQ